MSFSYSLFIIYVIIALLSIGNIIYNYIDSTQVPRNTTYLIVFILLYWYITK